MLPWVGPPEAWNDGRRVAVRVCCREAVRRPHSSRNKHKALSLISLVSGGRRNSDPGSGPVAANSASLPGRYHRTVRWILQLDHSTLSSAPFQKLRQSLAYGRDFLNICWVHGCRKDR